MNPQLTAEEIRLICAALIIAAEQWDKDAAKCRENPWANNVERIAQAFEGQAAQARHLISILE